MLKLSIIKEKSKMSFKEAIDLTGIPVVTFETLNSLGELVKLNFILDTGSSVCFLNERAADDLGFIILDSNTKAIGLGNQTTKKLNTKLRLFYNKQEFNVKFGVINLNTSFDEIKRSDGVTLHGILGNDFLAEHKYILDFDDMVAYYHK